MEDLINQIDENLLPNHVAMIMDGNGRWAKKRGLLRIIGHENGTKTVKTVVETSAKIGVKNLTLYAFSTENWNRPKLEVDTLMGLLSRALKKETENLIKNRIRLSTIGNIDDLPKKVKKEFLEAIDKTKEGDRMTLNIALSYGSRNEITNAFKAIAEKVKKNTINIDDINESLINSHLYTNSLPDVDLMIRTSGEKRISNFLLWQIAYAELYFTDVLWPDFDEEEYIKAIINYQSRERRFGKTSEQLT